MMSTLYRMGAVTGRDGICGFTGVRRMTFADQIAVDAHLAAEDLAEQKILESRMEKVMRLKAAIEEGRYFVSSHDLAEKMMASMFGEARRRVH